MENNIKPRIKSFIYLDEDKMYSISSQLFEGMTQYILQENVESYNEEHQQKGNFLSGRFMADMLFQRNSKSEMRFLHDFAFNLFEEELQNRKLLYDVECTDELAVLQSKEFVRLHGKIIFCDYARMQYVIDKFNDVGRALGNMQGLISSEITNFANEANNPKDRELKNKQKQALNRYKKIPEDFLREQGLMLDKTYIKDLSTLMNFGFQDVFEIRFVVDGSPVSYSAIINPANLKEKEQILISKYSRMTEREFTLLGIVTQSGNSKPEIPTLEGVQLKGAVQGMHQVIANLEQQFIGVASNECIIDPIAIFTEL